MQVITMENRNKILKILGIGASYILVAALASALTVPFVRLTESTKLGQLKELIQARFVGEVEDTALDDGAAMGMIAALDDRWSYYIPASEYAQEQERKKNDDYVGIGITITARQDGAGFDIISVAPEGAAIEAGILPGDILIGAEGKTAEELGLEGLSNSIAGEAGTEVSVTVLRDGEELTFTMLRKQIPVTVASGEMINGNIGLVTIDNFNEKCAQQTIEQVEKLLEQGAKALIFDVRNNPGGYQTELVQVLDYLLPEGDLFITENYAGTRSVDTSDENCIRLPMAVLVNGDSYSAAEFFAAALSEYDWAQVVGEQTSGKGYYQITYPLSDGSAVALSSGKYFTPKGVSLAEVGGLTPDIPVEVDEETARKIITRQISPMEDPQIQAAVASLGIS